MQSVSVTDAKARLSEIVRLVEQGEVVLLLRHGRPVARMGPLSEVPQDARRATTAALIREGKLVPGPLPPDAGCLDELDLPATPGLADALTDAVIDDREDRL